MPITIRTEKGHRAFGREVQLSDFNEGINNFKTRFFYGAGGALRSDPTRVDYTELGKLVPAATASKAAIAVYVGLQGDRTAFGIRVIEIDGDDIIPDLDSGDYRYPSHEILMDGTPAPLGTPSSWAAVANAYYATVHVLRAGATTPTKVDTTWDPKCTTFMWENEIKKMAEENIGQLAAGEHATLMLSNYAMYHGDETPPRHFNGPHGMRHSFCFYMQKLNADGSLGDPMLRDGNAASPYRYRGTNLGHLCPPRCRKTSDPGAA